MEAEITAAAKWWRKVLEDGAKQDAGDTKLNTVAAMFNFFPKDSYNEQQLQKFEDVLIEELKNFIDPEGWKKAIDDPMWGSYGRSIGLDYGPCSQLRKACESSGINERALPIKTIMWINPNSVSVRYGYGAEIKTVFGVSLK